MNNVAYCKPDKFVAPITIRTMMVCGLTFIFRLPIATGIKELGLRLRAFARHLITHLHPLESITTLLFLFCFSHPSVAQILPGENTVLCYRLIGFSFPDAASSKKYRLEIAAGYYNAEDSFKKNIVVSIDCKTDKTIGEVPSFGSQYTWRAVYTGNDTRPATSAFHHFSTAMLPEVDTSDTRLRITKHSGKYKDDFVFLDGNKALYDMDGRPVWCLPDIAGVKTAYTFYDDLKITPQSTITFINNTGRAYEVNYNGAILWKGPDNAAVSRYNCYHHEFTRLGNGHYMVLGMEPVFFKDTRPATIGEDILIGDGNQPAADIPDYRKDAFGTLIEYDEKGNVVWSWKTAKYLQGSDVYYHTPSIEHHRYDVHENSFYFDEKNKVVYVGLRNISRIVKLAYPSGKVLADYGEIYKPGVKEKGNGLFCLQHSCRRSQKGYLYLYNNNVCRRSGNLPKIILMREPVSKKGPLKKIWEYECTIEDTAVSNRTYLEVSTGGHVIELQGDDLFVSMSSQYSKLFIIGRDKNILWSALPEKRDQKSKQWSVAPQYRASIITRQELEKLIWNSEGRE